MVIWGDYPNETYVMGVFTSYKNANEYIANLEEKADETLFEVRVEPYLLDEEYHVENIKEWIE